MEARVDEAALGDSDREVFHSLAKRWTSSIGQMKKACDALHHTKVPCMIPLRVRESTTASSLAVLTPDPEHRSRRLTKHPAINAELKCSANKHCAKRKHAILLNPTLVTLYAEFFRERNASVVFA